MKYKDGTFYETKLIPFGRYKAIMLFGFIFTYDSEDEWNKLEKGTISTSWANNPDI